jgi:enamine deaminase RidA (YjgF/YER057c/UK114 family)
MAHVHLIRHNPGAVFSQTSEAVLIGDDGQVIRLVEPSGNVGTQFPADVGSQWFGTIENLRAGLALGGATWSDVYKTDVLWTTPSLDREACDRRKNDFNAVYGSMISAVAGGPLRSNRMARFTHAAGYPDPKALFEVQIKAARGGRVTVGNGRVDYGTWVDHQPSGASVMHQQDGRTVTTLGPDLAAEMLFVLEEQYAKPFAREGIDFRRQTAWMEILVGVDDAPELAWERIEIVRRVFAEYFGDNRPAGLIYPVSRIPNLDGIVEPQPRVVTGDVRLTRSGTVVDGFSTWTALDYQGIRELMVSAVAGDDAGQVLASIDAQVKEAGGRGLREDGVFNNAYVVAADASAEGRAGLAPFNKAFAAFYTGAAPAGRTAQFMGGIQRPGVACGISSRALFAP